jgi:dolichol-phosphate mannosyltransferase
MVSLLATDSAIRNRLPRVQPGLLENFREPKHHVDLSLVLPTYNERQNIPALLAWIDRSLSGKNFEVILVDDDSPDQTWAAAQELQRQYAWLRVIRRTGERGLGSAVIAGFRQSRGKILGVMDADLQHSAALLPTLLLETERAEFAVATRRAAGGSNGQWSQLRRFGSHIAGALARLFANVPFSDPMSGFFLMRREVFNSIDEGDLRPRGYKILVYLYAKAAQEFGRDELRVREVGYEFAERANGRSKFSLKVIFDYLRMLLELSFQTHTHKHGAVG